MTKREIVTIGVGLAVVVLAFLLGYKTGDKNSNDALESSGYSLCVRAGGSIGKSFPPVCTDETGTYHDKAP
jgi:hypothetical protein